MSLEQALNQSIAANQQLTQVVENKIGQIDSAVAQAQTDVDGFIAGARAEFPALNVMKNFAAHDINGDGVPESPLGFWTYSKTTWTQTVVPLSSVPGLGMQDKTYANVIEITLSRNAGNGFFDLLPANRVFGETVSAGCIAAMSNKDIDFCGRRLRANQPEYYIAQTYYNKQDRNIDLLLGTVLSDNTKLWIFLPWASSGYVQNGSMPLLTINGNYYNVG